MIIAIDKPQGPTSHDIIDIVRCITGVKRVGHAGTLDPLARGILIIGIGREATRQLNQIVAKEKEYIATIRLGISSTTDDEAGEKLVQEVANIPDQSEIRTALQDFIGIIEQQPPIYSALKINGQPAYKAARQGRIPELQPRQVEIKAIELIDYQWPILKLRIITGPGVYIRALARDLGIRLKTGGYLSDLERTRVGDYTQAQALTTDEFAQQWTNLR